MTCIARSAAGRVAWLASPLNRLPNPVRDKAGEPVHWVYAERKAAQGTFFYLPLKYQSLDENHNRIDRDLILSEEICTAGANSWPTRF